MQHSLLNDTVELAETKKTEKKYKKNPFPTTVFYKGGKKPKSGHFKGLDEVNIQD